MTEPGSPRWLVETGEKLVGICEELVRRRDAAEAAGAPSRAVQGQDRLAGEVGTVIDALLCRLEGDEAGPVDRARAGCEVTGGALRTLLQRRHDARRRGATDEELAELDLATEAAWQLSCAAKERLEAAEREAGR